MNRVAVLLALSLSLPISARADDASHRAKAAEMMSLLHTDQMVENIAGNLKKQLPDAAANVIGPNAAPEKKADAATFVKSAGQIIDNQLGWSVLQPAFTDIYVKSFTEEQLDGILAFYKSPAGLALLTIMPTVNTQVSQYGEQKMGVLRPQLQQLYEAFQKSDGTAPVGSPSTPAPAAAPSTPAARPPSAPK